MTYDPKTFTWGYEIEWGDIDRRLKIDPKLAKWEFAETDIVNIHEPYENVACDPLGIEPPMGGELNVAPTKTREELVDRIMTLYDFFVNNGNSPSAACVNHGHAHVYIPGLKDDLTSLKKMIIYIKENQADTIPALYGYQEHILMKFAKTAKTYLKWDGGRPMPDYMCDNIINLATDFDHFIKLHAAGKDGVSMGRPFRYAINTYCMKHTGTIEFRCFRSSIDRREISDSLKFVEEFMVAALNTGKPVKQILAEYDYQFPKFKYNSDHYMGWEATKYDKSRGNKQREFLDVA